MNKSRRLLCTRLALAGLMVLIVGNVARAQAKIDISGPWVFTIQEDPKPVTAQITFKVDGGRLSGHVSSTPFGEQDFTGTIEGAAFEFAFNGDAGQIQFKGTADTNGTLKGTFESPGTGGVGAFAAKRKE